MDELIKKLRKSDPELIYTYAPPVKVIITTRGVGFGVTEFFNQMYRCIGHRFYSECLYDIYAMYRVYLALFQAKVYSSSMSSWKHSGFSTFNFLEISEFCPAHIPLFYILHSVGKVKYKNIMYYPEFLEDTVSESGQFIPRSEGVLLTNLRKTVLALSNKNTPKEIRRQFRANCPIPGTIWEGSDEDPLLANAVEIMPEVYDHKSFYVDLNEMCKINYHPHTLHLNARRIDLNSDGSEALLISNKQSGMYVSERMQDETLQDYYKRLKVEGDIPSYWSREPIDDSVIIRIGCASLLGELPCDDKDIYPKFINRMKQVATMEISLTYRDAVWPIMRPDF